jgi:hypothetical protein
MGKCLFSGCQREAIDGALYCPEHDAIETATEMRSYRGLEVERGTSEGLEDSKAGRSDRGVGGDD